MYKTIIIMDGTFAMAAGTRELPSSGMYGCSRKRTSLRDLSARSSVSPIEILVLRGGSLSESRKTGMDKV